MTQDLLGAILETIAAKSDKTGWSALPEGRTLTLYAAHDGVQLTIARVEAMSAKNGLVRARTVKGEMYLVSLDDLFAVAAEATPTQSRKPGFA
jgi:hypothetical protein